ncbi:MAG: hypothetical protein WCK49_10585 [Myxococcaceae bacterium]
MKSGTIILLLLFLLFQGWNGVGLGDLFAQEDVTDVRLYNQMAWLSSHNAFNNSEDGWLVNNNQSLSYERQYEFGVRGFFLDLYWYNPGSGEKAYIALCHENKDKIGLYFGGCPLTLLTRLDAPPKFETFLKHVKGWLQKDPAAIITLHLESYLGEQSQKPLKALLKKTGLAQFLFKEISAGKIQQDVTHWKTLKEMRQMNQRLVIFSDNRSDGFVNIASYRETKYDLGQFPHCEMRGEGRSLTNDLFVMNHFYEVPWSMTRDYVKINSFGSIAECVVKCCQEQGRLPNFIVLDFVEQGEAGKLVSQLNKLNFSQRDPKQCASIIAVKIEKIEPRSSEL